MSKKELRLSVLDLEKLGVTLAFPQYPDTKAEETSRRIVACVNACEGISTENLEYNLPVKELAQQYNKVIRQRDELLAALERIASTEIADALWDALCMKHTAEEAIVSVKGGAT